MYVFAFTNCIGILFVIQIPYNIILESFLVVVASTFLASLNTDLRFAGKNFVQNVVKMIQTIFIIYNIIFAYLEN